MRIATIILVSTTWFTSHAQTRKLEPLARAQTYTYVEQMPEFRGNLEHYIADNRRQIRSATRMIVNGTVVVTFIITKAGNVEKARILKTDDSLLNRDAIRLVGEMPVWNAAKQNGRSRDLPYTLKIIYK